MLPYRRPSRARVKSRRPSGALPKRPKSMDDGAEGANQDWEAEPPVPQGANSGFASFLLGALAVLTVTLVAVLSWYGRRHGHPSGACWGGPECLAPAKPPPARP